MSGQLRQLIRLQCQGMFSESSKRAKQSFPSPLDGPKSLLNGCQGVFSESFQRSPRSLELYGLGNMPITE